MLKWPRLFSSRKYAPTYPTIPRNTTPSDDGYTVGFDVEGNTVLKVAVGSATSSLTMNSAGVKQMIRLLEATIDPTE